MYKPMHDVPSEYLCSAGPTHCEGESCPNEHFPIDASGRLDSSGKAFPSRIAGKRSMRYEIRRTGKDGSSYRVPSDQPTKAGNETSYRTREQAQRACDRLNKA